MNEEERLPPAHDLDMHLDVVDLQRLMFRDFLRPQALTTPTEAEKERNGIRLGEVSHRRILSLASMLERPYAFGIPSIRR
jgi:hypothetical protein